MFTTVSSNEFLLQATAKATVPINGLTNNDYGEEEGSTA